MKNKYKQKKDNKTIKEIKNKVKNNNLILTKADKSQATVIIEKVDYIKTVSYTHLDVYKRQVA